MSLTSKKIRIAAIVVAACVVVLAGGIVALFKTGTWDKLFSKPSLPGTSIVCRIHPLPYGLYTPGLQMGYTYHLLTEFANSIGATIDISICEHDDACLDSIKAGAIDILAFPYADTLEIDSVLVSVPVDSLSVWIVSADKHKDMKNLNKWISTYSSSADHDSLRQLFLREFVPSASRIDTLEQLSPYDSLFRKYAEEIGWDWHVLAAVAYQESMFHIEAESHKGAVGLMQLMPATAARFEAGNMLDPEQSIKAGCDYLSFLYKHYRRSSADNAERLNFTLAAYNAGEGRIDKCKEIAGEHDADSRYWYEVSGVFDAIDDFKGAETARYVERVQTLSARFRRICP